MADRVGIVAAAQTKYEAAKPWHHLSDLVLEVTDKVIAETGVSLVDDVESVVSNSQDHWDGRTISSIFIPDVTSFHLKDESKVAGDGAYAILYGAMHILSGDHRLVLVVSHCKESHTDGKMIENWSTDHIFHRMLGLDYTIGGAMQARRYMDKYAITREHCAKVVVKNKGNAKNNPFAQEWAKLTIDDVLKAEMLADPITALDAKPISDGACAILLATEELAKKLTRFPVWIKGVGNCYDAHFPGDRELADCDALIAASNAAYKMAGMEKVGQLYNEQEYFVPELLVCADALYAGLDILKPHVKGSDQHIKLKVVIGTVEGDIHDIGKNLVKVMFDAAGWTVYDLGKDVKLERFAEEQQRTNADIVAISTLLTTSMLAIPKVIEMVKRKNPNIAVIVGGAPLTRDIARSYGADGYAPNAGVAVQEAIDIINRREKNQKS